jgi:hypothetical protein
LPIASTPPTGDESRSDEGSEIRGEPDETRRRKDEEKGERRIHLQGRGDWFTETSRTAEKGIVGE